MKLKKIVVILILCIGFISIVPKETFATDISSITNGMQNVGQVKSPEENKITKVLNAVIRLIQVAGTGISVLVVTILGAKYMLASASEKADIKKTAMPIIIGCVLLFAATNLVSIIAGIGNGLN